MWILQSHKSIHRVEHTFQKMGIRLPFRVQLKITYSRHRDLNVKGNNDKSADYTGGLLGAPGQNGAAPATAVIPASAYQGAGSDLLMGGYGGAVTMTEASPTGRAALRPLLIYRPHKTRPIDCVVLRGTPRWSKVHQN